METTEKVVTYWCKGCKKEVLRRMRVARLKHTSFCATAGKDITMRRVRWTR